MIWLAEVEKVLVKWGMVGEAALMAQTQRRREAGEMDYSNQQLDSLEENSE